MYRSLQVKRDIVTVNHEFYALKSWYARTQLTPLTHSTTCHYSHELGFLVNRGSHYRESGTPPDVLLSTNPRFFPSVVAAYSCFSCLFPDRATQMAESHLPLVCVSRQWLFSGSVSLYSPQSLQSQHERMLQRLVS